MKGFDLPKNYIENPEELLRRTRSKLNKVSLSVSEVNQIRKSLTP